MGVLTGCKPRDEVLQGDLDDAIFAADFGDVVADRGPAVYRVARVFFRNTHPAERLRKLVEVVFGRLADPKDAGVTIRLSTGFGGGKTHTLIALYHLGQNINDSTLGTELLPAAGRPKQVKVVALDAQKGGVPVYSVRDGRQVNSLWGDVFYQLGGLPALSVLGSADSMDGSPSESQIEAVLPCEPILFLFDEVVTYMAGLSAQGQGNLMRFLQSLMSVVGKRPQTALLVTDPADQRAYQSQAEQLATALGSKLDDIFSRKATDFNPIEGEAARVIVRRLFDEVNPHAAQKASATYHELFKRVATDEPGSLPPSATSPEYARRLVECYPFHPRLLDTAQDRLGALGDFQRSRGVLRLFARILRDIWDARQDVDVISAGELDWNSPRIRADLLQRLNRDAFRAAADADVDRHAGELDGGAHRGAHRRVASALLLESLPLQSNSGMDRAEVTLAVLRPDEAGTEPGEALDRLTGVCWHTYPLSGGRSWQFRVEPNIIKQVEERMARISREDAKSRVLLEARQYFNGPQFKLAPWPSSPKQVMDSAGLQLVLCDEEGLAKRVCELADDTDPQAPMPRRFRNSILAVAPTTTAFAEAVERAQRLLAVNEIENELRGEPHRLAREQLGRHRPDYIKQFRVQTIRAFDRIVRAGASVKTLADTVQTDDDKVLQQQNGQTVLMDYLEKNRLIYGPTDELDVDRFIRDVLSGATPVPGDLEVFAAKSVHERFLEAAGLRLIRDAGVVRRTVQKAVREGKVVVQFADGRAYDDKGCVSGPGNHRQRNSDTLDSFALDDTVLITIAGSAAATKWVQTTDTKSATDNGDDNVPPTPPPLATRVTVTNLTKLAEYAETRPLITLALTAHVPDAAKALMTLAPALGAASLTCDVSVSGEDCDGAFLSFTASRAKPNHPAKPLDVAGVISRVLGATASYEATLTFKFDETAQTSLKGALSRLPEQVPAGVTVLAEFDRPR